MFAELVEDVITDHLLLLMGSYCPLGAASRSITLKANSAEPAQGKWVDFAWSGRTELRLINERTAMKINNLSRGMVKYAKAGKEAPRESPSVTATWGL